MSNINVYRTGKLTDKRVIELFDAIEKAFGNVGSNVHLGTVPVDYKEEQYKKIFKNGASITKGDLRTDSRKFHIKFRRGVCKSFDEHEQRSPSPYFDEIIVVNGTHKNPDILAPEPQEIIKCDEIVRKFVTNVLPENVGDEAQGATDLLQAQISSLASQYQDMISGIDKRRADLDKEHDKKMGLLDKSHQDRLEELQKKREEAELKLKSKQEALDEREKTLDDRDHMHVRRDLRQNINTEIKDRLEKTIVSPSAHAMRWSVFFLALGAAVVLGYISISSIDEFGSIGNAVASNVDQPANTQNIPDNGYASALIAASGWFLIIKTLLSSFGAIGALFYAISWLRKLYLDDVRTERELERYAYDINRASWAIETIMEMQTTKGAIPPQTWIEAICNNLFGNEANDDHKHSNPVEELLNSSAKVEFGPDGTKFELNKRGAQKLAKKISND